jgi:hypothetical protein
MGPAQAGRGVPLFGVAVGGNDKGVAQYSVHRSLAIVEQAAQ